MTSIEGNIKQSVSEKGIEGYFKKYLSFYHAVVLENQDPEESQRIKFKCEELGIVESDWTYPFDSKSNSQEGNGDCNIPEVGAEIFVKFKYGSLRQPYYLNSYFFKGKLPDEFLINYPNRRGVKIDSDFYRVFDKKGKEYILQVSNSSMLILDKTNLYIGKKQTQNSLVKSTELSLVLNEIYTIIGVLNEVLSTFMQTQATLTASIAILSPLTPAYTVSLLALELITKQIEALRLKIDTIKSQKAFIDL